MDYTVLGNTGLRVSRTAFGSLPIQRCSEEDATKILRHAFDSGINFFDTARGYTSSEEKIGRALGDVRKEIVIATKSHAGDVQALKKDLETSLRMLKTDYVDLYQAHNRVPGDEIVEAMNGFVKEGKIRHFGITLHAIEKAHEAIDSGLYETLQFPFSCLSLDEDIALVNHCKDAGMGFIAMKAMSGGLIQNVAANFAFMRTFDHVVPIWGIQRMSELDEFLTLEENPPVFDEANQRAVLKEKEALGGRFCRGCGYCLPCPADINLWNACRMDLFLKRGHYPSLITKEWQTEMAKINNCTGCRTCATRCPYHLKPYELIKDQLAFYTKFVEEHRSEVPNE